MCIIIAVPNDKTISNKVIKRCWSNNPNGGGFMFTDGKEVRTYKQISSVKAYISAYNEAKKSYPKSKFILHFRISTHGKINEDNCHPFLVNNNLGFAHNGIIRNASISPDYSDTVMFNNEILRKLPKGFLKNESILELIREYIGSGSKLAFLSSDNNFYFVNEVAGVWDSGVWYSNAGYRSNSYYDIGGVKGNYTSNKKYHYYYGSNYKQGNMGFASAAFPPSLPDKKPINKYEEKCVFCDSTLNSYYEKQNLTCNKCHDMYEMEYKL